MKRILLIIIILPFFYTAPVSSERNWSLGINKNGIRVYSRPVKGTKYYEYKSVALIDAKLEVIGEVLRDVNENPKWMAGCKESRILKDLGNDNLIIYYIHKARWPISNRDAVIKISTRKDYPSGIIYIDMQSITSNLVPPSGGMVRIKNFTGNWILEYVNRNTTRVSYTMSMNLGGYIPDVIARYGIARFPYKTFLGLKKMVKLKKYIEKGRRSKDRKIIEKLIKSLKLKT